MIQVDSETSPDGRPAFPSRWGSLDITLDELNLAHTLPVGQTFLWHRQPLRKEGQQCISPPTSTTPLDLKTDFNISGNDSTADESFQTVIRTETVSDAGEHRVNVKVEAIEEEVTISVKDECQDSNGILADIQEYSNEAKETEEPEAAPLEEWSRAISNPPRVILLRQTPTKIYYTSVLPSTAEPSNRAPPPDDDCIIGNSDIDRDYLLDFFNIDLTASFGSLKGIYSLWAGQDPSLFGRAWKAQAVPQGVRVLRQDPWECLIDDLLRGTVSAAGQVDQSTVLDSKSSIDRLQQILRDLGFGYRAGFISSSLQTLVTAHGTTEERNLLGIPASSVDQETDHDGVETFLLSLRQCATYNGNGTCSDSGTAQRWRNELLRLKGVGRKVADCVGLMSLDQKMYSFSAPLSFKANIVPIDTHLQQIAARHPRFPAKLKSKSTSTEGVYNAVQTFLCDLWGGGDEESSMTNGTRPRMKLAGWCQSVMFAADLKGSTAVVNVKVEVSTLEERIVKLEPESQPAARLNAKSLKRKPPGSRATAMQLETPDTASIISDSLLDQKSPSSAPPANQGSSYVSQAEVATLNRKRKRVSTVDRATAKPPKAAKANGRSKTTSTHTLVKADSSQVSETTSTLYTNSSGFHESIRETRRASGRSERYAARCDKLEAVI
ncbi:hypothetical protein QFC19_000158 [Naganishia cerealis]|uniref:Uncharacterized protein n=1 Tax=Naganishia cerealis TaxID=610337 RepID=A0ACC2WQQ7_9TREE|nr:hypothetical protein QFC19_000158 [Naganishia cerealis]